ncbi:hypothetical protein E4U56_006011 [Claviceps arundinis]|uniref:Uncharacterized protein n=1 Tax=Claviceps arundinis TaxID=1623583 RepID=A0A9P7MXD4_9HYPO|nr:hypothetical protein E4U56_006011 [Claviceps arundinis]
MSILPIACSAPLTTTQRSVGGASFRTSTQPSNELNATILDRLPAPRNQTKTYPAVDSRGGLIGGRSKVADGVQADEVLRFEFADVDVVYVFTGHASEFTRDFKYEGRQGLAGGNGRVIRSVGRVGEP